MRKRVFLFLVVILAMTAAIPALAQQPAQQTYVVTYIDVFPQFAATTSAALKQLAVDSLKDAGAVRFEVFRDIERTNHFTIVEVWRDRAAYDAHLQQPNTKLFREKVQPGLGGPLDTRLYIVVP